MPERTVPLPRLLLAWLVLVGGLVTCWAMKLVLAERTWLITLAVGWTVTGKTASLLCLAPADRRRLSWLRVVAFLIFPGLQPRLFLPECKPTKDDVRPTFLGLLINAVTGVIFAFAIPALLPESTPLLVRVWSGLIGWAFLSLFVRFDVAVMIFRGLGFGVERFWHCPIASTSVAEFWGVRWNRLVSGFLREVVFLPLARRAGATAAMAVVFFYSGLYHETFSFIAGGGYGLPMLYFLLQGAGVWIEGRRGFRRLLLRRPWLGRAWTFAVVVGPVALIINPWVVEGMVIPLLRRSNLPGIP